MDARTAYLDIAEQCRAAALLNEELGLDEWAKAMRTVESLCREKAAALIPAADVVRLADRLAERAREAR